MSSYIRFDWEMKRLLRNKANFAVLEGLLTTLLNDKITIQKLLESESNQEEEFDKYNRVDMLAEDSKGTLLLIEIQNNNEYAYFQRMLFGTSKLVTNTSIGERDMTRFVKYIASTLFISLWGMERISFIMERPSSVASIRTICWNCLLSNARLSR